MLTLTSLDPLTERIRRITGDRIDSDRVMVGLVGAPGSGKSTLARRLVAALRPDLAQAVPMDGFHLAAEVIAGTELQARRGAADTYDVGGFISLLHRLRARDEDVVYAPRYEREIEDPIGSAVAVPHDVRYVIVEGNHLSSEAPGWKAARAELDEVWHIDIDPALRLHRLVERHVEFGKSREQAHFWSYGSDEVNARLVEAGRSGADLVINVEQLPLQNEE